MGQNHQNDFSIVEKYLLIFYLIPVALLVWFVASFSVNVPFLDHWSLVSFFNRIAAGDANFGNFFAQTNEHRLFFPKIIFSLLAFASKWNVKIEQWCSIVFAIVSFSALYKISAYRQNNNKLLLHLVNIPSCMLFFSLVQFGNWLWGFQLAWYLINACVILAVFILTVPKNLPPYFRLYLAALCCFIASFSSAHGLLSWLAVIPSVAFVPRDAGQKKVTLVLWVLLFISCCAIYSIGYQKPVYTPDIFFFLKKPLVSGAFLLMIVGSSLGQIINPAISGFVIILNFLFLLCYYFKNYHSEFARDAAPLLSLGLFATLFVLLVTTGRAGYGVGQSLVTTYTTVSILLIISSIQMWRLIISHHEWASRSGKIISVCCFVVGFLTAIFIANSTAAIAEGRGIWVQRTGGKTCLEVIHYLDKSIDKLPDNCLLSLSSDFYKATLREEADLLNRLGFRSYPKDIAFTTQPIKTHGNIEIPAKIDKPLTLPRNLSIKVSGWASLPDGREQPRVVLLSYENNKSFFASAFVNLPRPDVGRMLKSGRYSRIGWDRFGWEVNIPGNLLRGGETAIKAWVYDRENKQFVKLNGESKIKVIDN